MQGGTESKVDPPPIDRSPGRVSPSADEGWVVAVTDAIEYIRANGSPVEIARLDYLIGSMKPSVATLREAIADQLPGGGWPAPWSGEQASVDATCFRLSQLWELGMGSNQRPIREAMWFLLQQQKDDGAWQESADLEDVAPFWAKPSEARASLYLTANGGLWCALLDSRPAAMRAAELLERSLRDGTSLPTFGQAYWLAAGLFFVLGRAELSARLLSALDPKIDSMPAGALAWMGMTMLAAGIPPDLPGMQQISGRLEETQAEDGGWTEAGESPNVHTAVQAVAILQKAAQLG